MIDNPLDFSGKVVLVTGCCDGRLDAAFNNAGVMSRIAPTAESTGEEWDRVIGINCVVFVAA